MNNNNNKEKLNTNKFNNKKKKILEKKDIIFKRNEPKKARKEKQNLKENMNLNKERNLKKEIISNKNLNKEKKLKNIKEEKLPKEKKKIKKLTKEEINQNRKKFTVTFIILIGILAISFVKKSFQNDTFYTIKIGELILNNGIDMMDHFSYHTNLAYTYPHWLYDVFIYLIYKIGGYTGLYISSIVLFLILLGLLFKTNKKITNSYSISAFATLICALAISSFVTARAQLASFLVFVLQIYFIESFLKNGNKKYLGGLLLLSLILCNIHVAVWPFYYIIFLPYLVEYLVSFVLSKIKKENKLVNLLKKKFTIEKNDNIKYIFITMLLSLLTGLLTPIKDTPYTYLIKTMMGNSQDYIQEHQMLSWMNSPFTIIIAAETIILSLLAKVKLRDFFMICGLVLMSISSTRHLSLLALIGTICFARIFHTFLERISIEYDNWILSKICKKAIGITSFTIVIIIASLLLLLNTKKDFIDKEFYPIDAVKYIKENIDIDKMRIYNEYNFGSYLLYNDIPVFIDSRADLYTKQFSGFEYDIFDDYSFITTNYQEKFNFYDITHILIYKEKNPLFNILDHNSNYLTLYEDEYFVLYERLSKNEVLINFD